MNTKQLMVVAGLMLLATACKEEEMMRPAYVLPVVSSTVPAPNQIDSDSVHTTDGKSGPMKVRTTEEQGTTSETRETASPRQDVMPVQVEV